MTLATLFAPIATATVLNVFLFALAWKGSQIEKQRGSPPWLLVIGLLIYSGSIAAFAYFARHRLLTSGFDIFMVALSAEAMGGAIVQGLLHAFIFSRGQPKAVRAFQIIATLFLAGIMIGGMLFG